MDKTKNLYKEPKYLAFWIGIWAMVILIAILNIQISGYDHLVNASSRNVINATFKMHQETMQSFNITNQNMRKLDENSMVDRKVIRNDIAGLKDLIESQNASLRAIRVRLGEVERNLDELLERNATTIESRKATGTLRTYLNPADKELRNLTSADDTWQPNCYKTKSGNTVCYTRGEE